MTSNNRVNYTIFNKRGDRVGHHSQNIMCKRCNDGLEKYQPASDYIIQLNGYDEDGDEVDCLEYKLDEWLSKNKAEFTFRKFNIGENVLTMVKTDGKNKREEVEVIESFKGKWHPYYTVKTKEGIILEEVQQTDIIPL